MQIYTDIDNNNDDDNNDKIIYIFIPWPNKGTTITNKIIVHF